MIIGLSIYNPDRDFLDSLARAGIDCVELSLPGRDYDGFDYAAFATRARDAGLDIRSFHLPFYLAPEDGPVDPASLDADVRKRTAEVHARFVRTAAAIGARLAVVHACLEQDSEPRRAERIVRAKESLVALADVAEPLGVAVCVEDLPRTCLGNTAEELADIVSCDERLRVCFDVNHLLYGTHADFLRLLGPKIVATHISDYDFVNERHWLPGEGKIDWPALMDGLDAIGYAGAFTYELGFKGDPRTVARSRDLTPEDIVRNAREIEARHTLTVIGGGGLPNLPM